MNLQDAVATFKAGGGISNPISAQVAALTPKGSTLSTAYTPVVIDLGTALNILLANASPVVASAVAGLKTNLPLMNAVNDILNKIHSTTGQRIEFTNAFSPLTDIPPQLTSLNAAITDVIVSRLASYNEFVTITTEDYNLALSLTGQVNAVASIVTNRSSISSAALADSYPLLSAYSFANFTSGTKPTYIENLFNICVTARVTE